eukprot:scpid16198/ scgid21623/ 
MPGCSGMRWTAHICGGQEVGQQCKCVKERWREREKERERGKERGRERQTRTRVCQMKAQTATVRHRQKYTTPKSMQLHKDTRLHTALSTVDPKNWLHNEAPQQSGNEW